MRKEEQNDSKKQKRKTRKNITIIRRNKMKNNYTYCLIVWIAFIRLEQKAKLNLLYDKKKNFCNVVILFGCTKLLEFNQYQIPDKVPFIIYTALDGLYGNILLILKRTRKDVTNFKMKKMKLLTNKQQKLYQNVKILYVCQERFEYEYCQVRSHCHEVLHKTSVI